MTILPVFDESVDVVVRRATDLLVGLEDRLSVWGELYRDLHRHPELSLQEHRTAGVVAQHLRDTSYEVTEGVGQTGVVGVLRNGAGPVVMLRGDMDALPIKEQTGVDYASEAIETTSEVLAKKPELWKGTVFICAQPAEEIAQGAQAMLRDGLFKRFPRPDICLGQHVTPLAAGTIGHNAGVFLSASINVDVRLFGKGGRGSEPELTVDPVIMASSLIMKLQTIRSRELQGDVPAVVTVGFVNAGVRHNVISDEAHIGLNIRTQNTNVQEQIISAIRRMAEAEAHAFRAPTMPVITTSGEIPLTSNSKPIDQRIRAVHTALLGSENVVELPTAMWSEDFSQYGLPGRHHYYGEPIPYCVWLFGGHSRERFNAAPGDSLTAKTPYLPSNHQPNFIPDPEPTLRTGVYALTSAALAYLPAQKIA